jgi:hypothetical protein
MAPQKNIKIKQMKGSLSFKMQAKREQAVTW